MSKQSSSATAKMRQVLLNAPLCFWGQNCSSVRNCTSVFLAWNYVELLVIHHVHPLFFQLKGLFFSSVCLFIYYKRIKSIIDLSWPRNNNYKASYSWVINVTHILKFCLFLNAKSQWNEKKSKQASEPNKLQTTSSRIQ